MLLKPYPIWGSPDNPSLAKAPTANPPPQYVYGALDFQLLNTGTSDIPVPFNVSIRNANYSQILQACLPLCYQLLSLGVVCFCLSSNPCQSRQGPEPQFILGHSTLQLHILQAFSTHLRHPHARPPASAGQLRRA